MTPRPGAHALLTSVDDRLREATIELAEMRTRMAAVEAQLRTLRHTVTTADRGVAMTLDAQGAMVELRFPIPRYRDMAPRELAAVLVRTYEQARTELATRTAEIVEPLQTRGDRIHHDLDRADPTDPSE